MLYIDYDIILLVNECKKNVVQQRSNNLNLINLINQYLYSYIHFTYSIIF